MKLSFLLTGILVSTGVCAFGAAPVLEDLLTEPASPEHPVAAAKVKPLIPVGKALMFPVTTYDVDSTRLTFSVTSSNPAILARVKTGNPILRMEISHASGGAGDPAYSGTLAFQLFRDWTPKTTGFISGFAQAGLYDNATFHRLADLNDDKNDLTAPAPANSFIYQGGALVDFAFEDEFKAPLMFAGRGQLAMANAGKDGNYNGTNGAQFFITHGNLANGTASIPLGGPRHLDFAHTVFGQLTHGWALLNKMRTTKRDGSDAPLANVKIVSASVGSQFSDATRTYTDAMLVLTATAPASSTITVTVSDGTSSTSKSFIVKSVVDTDNSAPFLVPAPDLIGPKDSAFDVPLAQSVDLEFDYTTLQSGVISGSASSSQLADAVRVQGTAGFVGAVGLAFGVTEFDMSYRGQIDGPARSFDDTISLNIGIGDKALTPFNAAPIFARPGIAVNNAVVAKFSDTLSTRLPGTTSARINWGDGSAVQAVSAIADAARASANGGQVKGSHTYSKPGVYTITVDLTSSRGGTLTVRNTAVVAAGPRRAVGTSLSLTTKSVSNLTLATFTDSSPAPASQYSAIVDWGDGVQTPESVVLTSPGKFAVIGKAHTYRDPEDYSLGIRIHKAGTARTADLQAWSTISLSGFSAPPHLPPFAQAHLVAEITQVALATNPVTYKPLRESTPSGDRFTGQIVVLNSGNIPSKASKVRFYLSADREFNAAAKGSNPADIALRSGSLTEISVPILAPGETFSYVFDNGSAGDRRLVPPSGVSGAGLNLLAYLTYSDPIANHMPILRAAVVGPL